MYIFSLENKGYTDGYKVTATSPVLFFSIVKSLTCSIFVLLFSWLSLCYLDFRYIGRNLYSVLKPIIISYSQRVSELCKSKSFLEQYSKNPPSTRFVNKHKNPLFLQNTLAYCGVLCDLCSLESFITYLVSQTRFGT